MYHQHFIKYSTCTIQCSTRKYLGPVTIFNLCKWLTSNCQLLLPVCRWYWTIKSHLPTIRHSTFTKGPSNWSLVKELYFGIPKCAFLSFNNKLPAFYHIDSNMLSHLSKHCDLGIQISSNLSWSNHYNMICSKAYRFLRRTFGKFGTTEAKRSLYLALVCSQLMYCSQLWNPYLSKDIFRYNFTAISLQLHYNFQCNFDKFLCNT